MTMFKSYNISVFIEFHVTLTTAEHVTREGVIDHFHAVDDIVEGPFGRKGFCAR